MLEGYNHIAQAAMGTLFTWGVTALGSALVFVFSRAQRKVLDGCLGFAAGVMTAASFWSLLAPGIEMAKESGSYGANGEYAFAPIAVGFGLGAAFVFGADQMLSRVGIQSDPSIGLANTVKSGEPNSSDTLPDSAVEMDDAAFRDSPHFETGSIDEEETVVEEMHPGESGDTKRKDSEPDKKQTGGKKKPKKRQSKKERRKQSRTELHRTATEEEILNAKDEDDDSVKEHITTGSGDFLDRIETVRSKDKLIALPAGLENPGLRTQGASRGAETKTAQSTHDEDHVIRLFNWKRILLLIVAITVHNIPEGLAVGVAFGAIGKSATSTFHNARNLAFGIGIQNFPEGLAVSLPLRGSGMSIWKSFMYGQLSGVVEPIAGVLGALAVSIAEPILPYALAFAAGAMIYVVIDDIIPEAQTCGNSTLASWGAIIGFIVMMSLDVGLGGETSAEESLHDNMTSSTVTPHG